MEDELKAFQANLETFDEASTDLDRWRLRAQKVERPQPGSDLAVDDAAFPHQPISETVRISLISAGEHLRLICDGLKCKNIYAMSQYSAARAAIVGATQAVWVLAPEDPATSTATAFCQAGGRWPRRR